MQFVDQQLDPFLDIPADGIFPEVLQIGDDPPSIAYDAGADRIEDIQIGVVDQMEQGLYFFVFLHAVGFLPSYRSYKYEINIGEVVKL